MINLNKYKVKINREIFFISIFHPIITVIIILLVIFLNDDGINIFTTFNFINMFLLFNLLFSTILIINIFFQNQKHLVIEDCTIIFIGALSKERYRIKFDDISKIVRRDTCGE